MARTGLFVPALLLFLLAAGCEREGAAGRETGSRPLHVRELFADVTDAAGVQFTHVNGMSGQFYFAEIIGSGVALFDYDNDGRLDLLVLQGTPLAKGKSAPVPGCGARLLRNESTGGRLRFTDVTETSGLCPRGYGMGIATGDFDN